MDVILGETREESIAATVFAIVDRAVSLRPADARALKGRVVRLALGDHPSVLLRFGDGIVEVTDDDEEVAANLEIAGDLADVNALLAAPLAGGVPNPTSSAGRAALARLADGRVALRGSMTVGRRVLQLLSLR
jgi:hypothetical protein